MSDTLQIEATARDFDFWMGSWDVANRRLKRRLAGSDDWEEFAATAVARPILDGGDAPMKFDFLKDMRKGDGFTLSAYSMGAHSGTHIDAPMHFVRDGASIEKLPLEAFIGPARIIDIPDSVQAIDAKALARVNWKGAERVIFRTRSALHGWMHSPTFHKDFAYVAPDAAQQLADAGVKLVGVDCISAVAIGAPAPLTHWTLLGKGIPIVEGLHLDRFQPGTTI